MMAKDESIIRLLDDLRPESHGWVVVDYWDGDRCAVGIGSRREPERLVYISTHRKDAGRFYFEAEAPDSGMEVGYRVVARGEDVSFEELLDVLVAHLTGE